MQTYTPSTVSQQIDQIRGAIRLCGFFVAECEELDFLCEGGASEEEKTTWIKQIGVWEGWTVERQPDDTVRFSSLLVSVDGSCVSYPAAGLGFMGSRYCLFKQG
jgi:hypothetical protein